MKTILIEGASTAYGSGDPENGGWASRLHSNAIKHSIESPADPIMVANFSYPGQTIRRMNAYLEQDINRMRAASKLAVVASVGLNEARIMPGCTEPILNIDDFDKELRTYLETTEQTGVTPVLMGPQRIDDTRTQPTTYGSIIKQDMVEEYGRQVATVAAEADIPYIDVNALQKPYPVDKVIAADGLHPTTFGHEIIYQATEETLRRLGAIWPYAFIAPPQGSASVRSIYK
jgi:lysophospholipase L1-like esterase